MFYKFLNICKNYKVQLCFFLTKLNSNIESVVSLKNLTLILITNISNTHFNKQSVLLGKDKLLISKNLYS